MSNKKQYLIREYNQHEGETYGYIVMLTDSEYKSIHSRFEYLQNYDEFTDDWGEYGVDEGTLSITPNDFTKDVVNGINNFIHNSYMDSITFCTISSDISLDNFWYEDFPMKMNGLGKIESDNNEFNVGDKVVALTKYGNKITNNNSYCIKCATELSQPYVYVVKDFGDEVGLSHLANGVDEFDYFMKTDIQLY